MPAQREIDPGFMTRAGSKMDISGCLRRRYWPGSGGSSRSSWA